MPAKSFTQFRNEQTLSQVPSVLAEGEEAYVVVGNEIRYYIGDANNLPVLLTTYQNGQQLKKGLYSILGPNRVSSYGIKNLPIKEARTAPLRMVSSIVNPILSTSTQQVTADVLHGSVIWVEKLGLFVCSSDNGTNRILTSPDGVTWTARTTPSATFNRIHWSERLGLLIAYGNASTNLITSPNGITWTARTIPGAMTSYVVEVNDLGLLLVGCNAGSGLKVATSSDGITWTARATPDSAFNTITYSGPLGVLISKLGSTSIAFSEDGINWTAKTTNLSFSPSEGMDILWVDDLGLFIDSTGNSTTRIRTSPDGLTWTSQTTPNFGIMNVPPPVQWNPSLKLLVAKLDSSAGSTRIMTSHDGITWTLRTTPNTNIFNLLWIDDLGLFITTGGTGVIISYDGVTWTQFANGAQNFSQFAFSPSLGMFVFVGGSGTGRVRISPKLFASGSFVSSDAKTVTVINGLITSIV